MPRALIACDKFKGSLTAIQACQAIATGLGTDWQTDLCPIADGGEGFTAAMILAAQGQWIDAHSHNALGRPITARYGIITEGEKRIAVMEMAAAAGIALIAENDRDIMHSSTHGVGEMIRHATEIMHVDEILIGIGGSATNDGGAGMATALGVKFLDSHGHLLAGNPSSLAELHAIYTSELIPLPPIRVACDVTNPLCSHQGASYTYAPQKGATPAQIPLLDATLQHLAATSTAPELAATPGAGAAGGLGFGFLAFLGATLTPGFTLVAQALHLHDRIAAADIVITGEGSLDAQSLNGKGPLGVAILAKDLQKPCLAFAGRIDSPELFQPYFSHLADIISLGHSPEYSMTHAAQLLETLARQWQK